MEKLSALFFIFLLFLTACAKTNQHTVYSKKFKPGEQVSVLLDINGDKNKEKLIVTSQTPEPEMGSVFNYIVKLEDSHGVVLYKSEEIGEQDWFSIDIVPFTLEGYVIRDVALIRSGCSGTGVDVNALFLYQAPDVNRILSSMDGNDGFYDSDKDDYSDMLINRYRMQNLGVIGASSPWLPVFSKPASSDDWETIDITFEVLARDAAIRQEWIDGVENTIQAIDDMEFTDMVGEEHLNTLKSFLKALRSNDIQDAKNIYYTGLND